MHKSGVSWGYYVVEGTEPDCDDDEAMSCTPVQQNAKTPGIWNPLPFFDTVREDGELANVQSVENFFDQASNGTLPAVAWIVPSGPVSEHPPAAVSDGQAYVTSLINAVMAGPNWDSSAKIPQLFQRHHRNRLPQMGQRRRADEPGQVQSVRMAR